MQNIKIKRVSLTTSCDGCSHITAHTKITMQEKEINLCDNCCEKIKEEL